MSQCVLGVSPSIALTSKEFFVDKKIYYRNLDPGDLIVVIYQSWLDEGANEEYPALVVEVEAEAGVVLFYDLEENSFYEDCYHEDCYFQGKILATMKNQT